MQWSGRRERVGRHPEREQQVQRPEVERAMCLHREMQRAASPGVQEGVTGQQGQTGQDGTI